MSNATAVAVQKRKYARVRDDNGELVNRATKVADEHKELLYDQERDFDGLVRLLLMYAPTCIRAIAELRGPRT